MYSADTATRFYATTGGLLYLQTATSLQPAVVKNPHFQVLNIMGLYDLATCYRSSEHVLDHLPIPPDRRDNITSVRVPAGHMTDADAEGLAATNEAFARFLETAS